MAKKKKASSPVYEAPVSSIVTREFLVIKTGTDAGFYDYASEKCIRYTYAFHQLYKRTDECTDENFIKEIKTRFSMCDIEYRSCLSDAKALRTSEEQLNEQRLSDIESLQSMMTEDDCEAADIFKYNNKIAKLVRQMNQNAVFSGRQKLRMLTKAYNKIQKAKVLIPILRQEITELEERISSDTLSKRDYKRTKYAIECKKRSINIYRERAEDAMGRIPKLKHELKESRILDASLLGEANRRGNRFVDFDLKNSKLTFKITNNDNYTVQVLIPDGFKEEIDKVQELIDGKNISVTVRFSKDMIKLQYDLAIVNGYAVDERARRADVKEIKQEGYTEETEKDKIKEVYKKYYVQQRENMLLGKIEGRCISIDMNPGEIGYSILQRDSKAARGFRIIACGRISWMCLMRRHKNKSSSAKAKKLNNKRKNAVSLAFKVLFEIAVQYKCSEFIMEDLDFNDEKVNNKSKESNRKCNNLWYRTLSENIINRRCVETGIRLVKENAVYTSFIGNIQYDFCDPTNASIEIGRRGLMRYTSGSFYPQMTQEDVDTMADVAASGDKGDAQLFTHLSWRDAYKSCKAAYKKKSDFEHRYRASLENCCKQFRKAKNRYYNSGI